jgi:hypothetical protein
MKNDVEKLLRSMMMMMKSKARDGVKEALPVAKGCQFDDRQTRVNSAKSIRCED